MKKLVLGAAHVLVAPFALAVLAGAALAARRGTLQRKRAGEKPRLLYGPTPIIALKYLRAAMSQAGYEARTVVYGSFAIFSQQNYDYPLERFFPSAASASAVRRGPALLFGPYRVFLWALRRFDVLHTFFDGGLLATTPLRFLEVQLLHLAGKKVVVFPYGSDVAVPSKIRSGAWRRGLDEHYPWLARNERRTQRQIDYFCRRADFVVACIFHFETMPRWDLLTTHWYPIDTNAWAPVASAAGTGPISIVHAPNHRHLKGTEYLVDACRRLRGEGCDVELRLLEGVPNDEVRRVMAAADVVGEQFLHGYGLNAIEGMSLGKPVLSNLTDGYYYDRFREQTGLDECPLVDASPTELETRLRELVRDPALRVERGEAGRRYVLKFHSYEAVARMWELVLREVWHGEPLDLTAWHPGRVGRTEHETNARTELSLQ